MNIRYIFQVVERIVNDYYFQYMQDGMQIDDIALLGSDITLSEKENSTADPAIWYDWLEAIDEKKDEVILKTSYTKEYGTISWYAGVNDDRKDELNDVQLNMEEGYKAAIRFLTKYADRLESEEIKEFIQQLTFEKWCAAFEEVSKKECMKLTKEESISN